MNQPNNKFNFFVPCDIIEKSTTDKNGNKVREMRIRGIASTNDKDADGETLEPSGYILDRFLQHGTINFEHKSKESPKFIVGEPTKAGIKNGQLEVEAVLWNKSKLANEIYDKMQEMDESGSTRRAGFSIEGKALERDPFNPKRITKALLTNLAITFSPVNSNTFADIVKGNQESDFVESIYDKKSEKEQYLYEFKKDGKTYRVDNDFKVYEVISKDMKTSNTAPLIPESLDKKVKVIATFDNINKAINTLSQFNKIGLFNDIELSNIKEKIKKIL